jgi:hypothetical protein
MPIHDNWTFDIAPYLWTTSINGTIGVGGRTADVDTSFSDILKVTDFAFAALGVARKGRWSIYGDLLYGAFSDTQDLPVSAQLEVELDEIILEFGAGYRPAFAGPVEFVVGGRYFSFDIGLDSGIGPGVDGSKSWVDPVVGFLLPYNLTDKWEVDLGASIGGFGVSADFAWELRGTIFYHFNDLVSVGIGYIHLDEDYEDDGFVFDAAIEGAAVSVAFSF